MLYHLLLTEFDYFFGAETFASPVRYRSAGFFSSKVPLSVSISLVEKRERIYTAIGAKSWHIDSLQLSSKKLKI
ncbi:hypothetical protein B0E44_08800 [Flavobacterium sp. A45]|nr:hypothetical protein B0E44_08800 [Flavobacterium sp. A45]